MIKFAKPATELTASGRGIRTKAASPRANARPGIRGTGQETLSLVSIHIHSGKIRFPKQGAELLIGQIVNFGAERHDDLADAFAALVLSIAAKEAGTSVGAYFEKEVRALRMEERILPESRWPPILGAKAHAVWSLGGGPDIAVGVYQSSGEEIYQLDFLEWTRGESIEEAIEVFKSKPYARNFGEHFAPIHLLEQPYAGKSTVEIAGEFGIRFRPIPEFSRDESTEAGKRLFGRLWMVGTKGNKRFLAAMEEHMRRRDEKRGVLKSEPWADWTMLAATVHRYAALVVDKMNGWYDEPDWSEIHPQKNSTRIQADSFFGLAQHLPLIANSNGCAGAGAFDAFGKGFNFGNATSGHVPYPGNLNNGNGADGPGTGSNNSNNCGNPQGNP